ncbi:LysR substrate-binding domain-containing protein, partial [Staphylococcus aureus]
PWRYVCHHTGQTFTVADTPRLLVSSPDAAVDAAIAGIGATFVLEHDVHDAIVAGKLRTILPSFEVEPIPIHVVYLSRDAIPAKLRR